MTLPFNFPDRSKRKYTCFCCGVEFLDFENFKNHIKSEHELGKDYLICPLSRCGACCRDLPSHFASKHPNEKMPKFKQNRSIIWKDAGGKKHKKPKFQDGWYSSQKMNGKDIHYRSSYERKVYEILEMWPEVVSFFGESCLKIPYFFNGEHYYLPDLQIIFTDGHIEIWEIKPATQTSMPINVAKRNAAIAYCETRNWKFQTITEKGIELLKNKVKLLLNEGK